MYMKVALLFVTTCLGFRTLPPPHFAAPTSHTAGWHPVCFAKDLTDRPYPFKLHEEEWVAWRGEEGVYARPNVCPHLGARLTRSSVHGESLVCPYHSVKVGVDSSDCQSPVHGECVVSDGIVWWSNAAAPEGPGKCEDLKPDNEIATVRMTKHLNSAFSDAWMNGMDWHHAGSVHKNTFGNSVKAPVRVLERWLDKDRFRVDFFYESNQRYKGVTGSRTKNYHEFLLPSTTYNKVSNGEQALLIHVAMRSRGEGKTVWHVTAQSNFVPNNFLGKILLSTAVAYIVEKEDAVQLQDMASNSEFRQQHSGHTKLQLDGVYEKVLAGPAPEWESRLLTGIQKNNTARIDEMCHLLGALNASASEWWAISALNAWTGTWQVMWTPFALGKQSQKVIETAGLETDKFVVTQTFVPSDAAVEMPEWQERAEGQSTAQVTNITEDNLIKMPPYEFHILYVSDQLMIRNGTKGMQILRRVA